MEKHEESMNCKKEIVILRGEEVKRTRTLWEEVFETDSREFVEYYYDIKAIHNICFVIEEKEQIAAMVHLTPYDICIKADKNEKIPVTYQTYYIVGVATRKQDRHKGYMTQLIEAAFAYMQKEKVLFTFLMPASPAIYEPFGFRYIYERMEYQMIQDKRLPMPQESVNIQGRNCELMLRTATTDEDCIELAEFAQHFLEKNYTFFLKRTKEYFKILLSELASENGQIYMVYIEQKLCGYFMYAKEEEGFVQEVLLEGEAREILFDNRKPFLLECKETKPIIMAKYLGTKGQEEDLLKELAEGKISRGFINEIV